MYMVVSSGQNHYETLGILPMYTVFRKKTPTHVFFYISVENV